MVVETWSGDWQDFIRSLIRKTGYDDAFDFVIASSEQSFGEMFRRLRKTANAEDAKRLAFSQFEQIFYIDAHKREKLFEAVAEAFVRSFRQFLKTGWNHGKRIRERRIDSLMRWPIPSFISPPNWSYEQWRNFQRRAWDEIESIAPPDDWCPHNLNDPIVQEVFSRVWPADT